LRRVVKRSEAEWHFVGVSAVQRFSICEGCIGNQWVLSRVVYVWLAGVGTGVTQSGILRGFKQYVLTGNQCIRSIWGGGLRMAAVVKRCEQSGILVCWRSFLRCAYVKVKAVWLSV